MTFVDTSAWYALLVPSDPNHVRANEWFSAYAGLLVTTDYVVDETLTLFRGRGQRDLGLDWGGMIFGPERPATIHYLTPAAIAAAWYVYWKFIDKDWSFTDCASKAVIDSLGIDTAFSFDRHFHQFGTVTVVP